jgi:formate-dependent nitrite reductase membrane component NrfD
MDTDLVLTVGIVLLALSLPSLLQGWVEQRMSRLGVVMVLAGASMIVAAWLYRPTGYSIPEIPGIMLKVVSRLLD